MPIATMLRRLYLRLYFQIQQGMSSLRCKTLVWEGRKAG